MGAHRDLKLPRDPSLFCEVLFKFRNLAEVAGVAFSKLLKSLQILGDWSRKGR